ncbi:MAG: hypothetical protein NTZ83_02965, partial [Candidatus Pacearchaeota archaeon]|nr:hypothetical protein [Candidatus Pacearchaeota archaeon]
AERKVTDALLRSHELNPDGNIPVNFHSAEGIAGSEWKTLGNVEGTKPREAKRLIAVDRESGKMTQLEEEKKYYPGEDLSEPIKYTPEKNLEIANNTRWSDSLTQVEFNRESAERIMQDIPKAIFDLNRKIQLDRKWAETYDLSPEEHENLNKVYSANEYLNEAERKSRAEFTRAYELAQRDKDEETMAYLKKISENYGKSFGSDDRQRIYNQLNPRLRSEALLELNQRLERIHPRLFVPIEEFAV